MGIRGVLLGLVTFTLFSSCASRPPIHSVTSLSQPIEYPAVAGDVVHKRTAYAFAYDSEARLAKWVAYSISPKQVAQRVAERSEKFSRDLEVKDSPAPFEYRGSGYDRGHLAPAADFRWSPSAMQESFLMTNMAPQTPWLNRQIWKKLEELTRQLAEKATHTYVVTGPAPKGKCTKRINARVCVPSHFFKAILIESGDTKRAIAFVIPQDFGEGTLADFALSIDAAEAQTGFDFFAALPDETEATIEASFRPSEWLLDEPVLTKSNRRKHR